MGAKKIILKLQDRAEFGTSHSRRARRAGKIPCVLYGHGQEAKTYYIEEMIWKGISIADAHLVELNSSAGATNALIKDVQFDYLKGKTVHIDFQEVRMDELITANVPIHGKGTPVGLSQGGFLEQVLHEIEVECLPNDIPSFIEVDINGIELEKSMHVSDLILPEKVKAITPANQTVFHVLAPKVEEVAATTTAAAEGEVAAGDPEVVGGKGKEEEEGEEGAVPAGEQKDKKDKKDKEKTKDKEKK
jgi:large subunit ribosomal protein L25